MYKANQANPILRSSLQGVVSHRIKTLLGTGHQPSGNIMDASAHITRLQAQSVIEYDHNQLSPSGSLTKQLSKRKHEKATRDNSLMLINQMQKNQNGVESGYETLQGDINKGQQNRGRSQFEKYPQVKGKLTGVANQDMKNLTGFEASPMVLQALVATNTTSKDTLVNLKRRIIEKRGYKEPLSTRSNHMHNSGLRSLNNPFSQDNESYLDEEQ